jgi:hypothetical protein
VLAAQLPQWAQYRLTSFLAQDRMAFMCPTSPTACGISMPASWWNPTPGMVTSLTSSRAIRMPPVLAM